MRGAKGAGGIRRTPPDRQQQLAAAYRRVGTETAVMGASPHRLVAMLFDGYMEALAQAQGNRAEAARRLGIHRQLLYRKLAQYGLGD